MPRFKAPKFSGVNNNVRKLVTLYETMGQKMLRLKLNRTTLSHSTNIFNAYEILRINATYYNSAYLTSSQINLSERAFVMHNSLQPNSWIAPFYCDPKDYSMYANPQIWINGKMLKTRNAPNKDEHRKVQLQQKQVKYHRLQAVQSLLTQCKETCLSMPMMKFTTQRLPKITLVYADQQKNIKKKQMQGFQAIVAQHAVDHLNGALCIDYQASKGRFEIQSSFQRKFDKSAFVIKDYAFKLRNCKNQQEIALCKQKYFEKLKQAIHFELLERSKNQQTILQYSDPRK